MGALTSPPRNARPPRGSSISATSAPRPRRAPAPPLLAAAGRRDAPGGATPSRSTAVIWAASSPKTASSSHGPRDSADIPAAGRLAGQGLDRRRRERMVAPGLVRDGTARSIRLGRPLDRTDGDRAIRPVLRHTFELAWRQRSTPGSTPPRTGSTRRTSTAGVSETSSWRRASPVTRPRCTSRPTTSATFSSAGENEWEVVLSDGWWRGRTGFFQLADGFGGALAFLGQLHADDVVVTTGPDWRSATGPLLTADLMAGQSEDHRARPAAWQPVSVADHGLEQLAYSPAPPTRRVQELRPVVGHPSPARPPGCRPRAEHQRLAAPD